MIVTIIMLSVLLIAICMFFYYLGSIKGQTKVYLEQVDWLKEHNRKHHS